MQLNNEGPSLYGVMAFAEAENAGPRRAGCQRGSAAANRGPSVGLARRVGRGLRRLAGRSSPMPPVTAVLLGGGVRMNARIAKAAARSLREVCGLPALRERGPVCQIVNGRVTDYPSTADAARQNGVTRARVFRLLGDCA